MYTIEQMKAARVFIGWSQDKLAKESGISRATVAVIELGTTRQIQPETRAALAAAFEKAGILFEADEDGTQWVGLRKKEPSA